jgi:hypothetical protein
MSPMHSAPFRFRLPHWGWFALSTVVLASAAVALSIWLPYYREQQIVQRIERWGGSVEQVEKRGPDWLRRIVGEIPMQVFDRVSAVRFRKCQLTENDLAQLAGLTSLVTLLISDTSVSDAGVESLQKALPKCTIHR